MKVLNDSQVKALIQRIAPEFKSMAQVMFNLGLRINEVTRMERNAVDLAAQIVYIHGKGDKVRVLPLDPNSFQLIKKEMKANRAQFVWERSYTYPYGNRQVRQAIYNAAAMAKLYGTHPHTLRHSRATTLLDAGIDLYRVKQLLGHADIRTTQVYLHYSVEGLRKAISQGHKP